MHASCLQKVIYIYMSHVTVPNNEACCAPSGLLLPSCDQRNQVCASFMGPASTKSETWNFSSEIKKRKLKK